MIPALSVADSAPPSDRAVLPIPTCPNWDRTSWVSRPDYIAFWADIIIEALHLHQTSRVLDIGCGRGNITAAIAARLSAITPVEGIDISDTIREASAGPGLSFTRCDASCYLSARPDNSYDGIVLKQVIHCLSARARHQLLDDMYRVLKPGGRAAILIMPPVSTLPLFPQASRVFAQEQLDYRDLAREAGAQFHIRQSVHCYHVTIPCEQYFALLRERFMSVLRQLSDTEIEQGIHWLQQHGSTGTLSFSDPLHLLTLIKPDNPADLYQPLQPATE